MLTENYHKIAGYLTEIFGANFIFLIIVLSTAAAVVYFLLISYIITQLDNRYFLRKKITDDNSSQGCHLKPLQSGLTKLFKFAKILFGLCLLVCGIVMLVLPGQGLITILIALSLIPFPGKNKLEQNILARKPVRSSLNWIRIKAKKTPFIFD